MLNVLVVCTGNSCRSAIAEALFNKIGQGRIKAFSAGSHPIGRLNAGAVALLHRHGISTEGQFSKSWDSLGDQVFDIVLTVCDNAAGEVCPAYLGPAMKAHWGTFDPGHVEGTEQEKLTAFEDAYQTFELRINKMLALPLEEMPEDALVAELNEIGKIEIRS